jgi:flagellar assembly protein FliH
MSKTLTINIDRPIISAKISDNYNAEQSNLAQDSEAQQKLFSEACQTINAIINKLNQFYDKMLSEHKEKIARLSVEIARKILAQKVQEGDYQIESIVKEVLNNAPTHQDMVVHLNPEDLTRLQKAQQDNATDSLTGIKLVPDTNIGRAECLLETSKGTVESLISEQLDRISKTLEKVE